jgi:hypothetical protein
MSKYINDRLSWELLIKRLNKIAGEKTYTIDYAYGNNLKIPYVWEKSPRLLFFDRCIKHQQRNGNY